MHDRTYRPLLACVALALALGSGACKKDDAPKSEATAEGEAAVPSGTPFRQSQPALVGVDALAALPKDTLAVAVVGDPAALLDELGREKVVAALRPQYEAAVAEVTTATGHNLLDPASWDAIGIDAHAPMGVAWLGYETESAAFFFGLNSPEKLKTFVYATGGKLGGEFETETVGDAVIIRPEGEGEIALVVRGETALLVLADRDEDGVASARRIASLAKEGSLAERAELTRLVGRLSYGDDLAAWLDVPAIAAAALAPREERPEDDPFPAMIARAKERNATAAELAQLEAEREEHRRFRELVRARERKNAALVEALTGPFGAVALGLEVDQGALTVKGIAPLEQGSLPDRFLRPQEGGFALPRALDEAPLYLAALRTDLAAWRSFLSETMEAEGEDLAEAEAMLAKLTGIDVEADLLPALDGSFAVALTGTLPLTPEDEAQIFAALGGAVTVGLADEKRARALFDKVRAIPPVAALLKPAEGGGGWRVAVPGWKTVHIALGGGQLAAATDRALLDRLEKGETGAWLKEKASPALRRLFETQEPAAVWATDMGLSVVAWMGMRSASPMAAEAPADRDAPQSAAWKAKKEEIAAVRKKAEAQRGELEALERETWTGLSRLVGISAALAQRADGALVVYGGQYPNAPDVPTFTAKLADAAVVQSAKAEELRRQLWDLEHTRWKLERELSVLRTATPPDDAATPPPPAE